MEKQKSHSAHLRDVEEVGVLAEALRLREIEASEKRNAHNSIAKEGQEKHAPDAQECRQSRV